jgi:hypothetical protein
MRLTVLAAALLAAFNATVLGLDRTGPIMEARVYFDNVRRLELLGDLAGELDVCTWQEDDYGGWLVINTDARQLARIQATGLATEVTWPDIRDKFRLMTGVDPDDSGSFRDFGYFFTYWEMQDTLDRLVANFPSICTKYSLGNSHQGRSLWCLKISDNSSQPEDEPACFFNGATHAREPTGTHCCIAFATHILSRYGTDSVATWLVNNREIFIVPVMNPDGYVYNSDSGGSTANWRKNRRVIQAPSVGVDLNRNYGYKWGYDNSGSSGQPSSETYRGPGRFSEPETQVIRDFLASYNVRTCMDFHTYGQYNMYPWGYANVSPPDQPVLREAVDTFRMNNNYPSGRTGQVYSTIYPVNGLSVDWEYSDTAGKFVTYAYTCELSTNDFWYGWNDSAIIHRECNINIPNLYYLARIAGVYFDPVSVTVSDSSQGNGDGRLDPGETASIWFVVKNRATHPLDSAYAITALLRSGYGEVTLPDSYASFPSIPRRSLAGNALDRFTIRASTQAVPGTRVPLRLEMAFTDAGLTYAQPVNFEIVVGNTVAVAEPTRYVAHEAAQVRPFLARDHVHFSLPSTGAPARLDIVSADGTRHISLPLERDLVWDCTTSPAGVYFARFATGRTAVTRRFSIVR